MFPPGTLVTTESGPMDVRRLDGKEKLLVFSPHGGKVFRPIRRLFMGSAPGKIFCVSTSAGTRFCATPDQPFAFGVETTRRWHDLFLAKREGLGFFLVTGNGMFRDALETRILFKRQEPASKESVWLLTSHKSGEEAAYHQALLSCQYGIPIFPAGGRLGERTMSEEMFRRLLIEVNTFSRARRLLADHHLEEDLSHWLMRALPDAELPHRSLTDVVYFGGEEGRHVLSRHPLGQNLRIAGERLRHLMTRQRHTETLPSRQAVGTRIESLRQDAFSDVQERIKLGSGKPSFLMPIAYARPGMLCTVLGESGPRDERIEQALLERFEGTVYGIETEGEEPLVAGGVVMGLGRPVVTRPAKDGKGEDRPGSPPSSHDEDDRSTAGGKPS